MAKILCTCCHRTAEVRGKHEFAPVPDCPSGTYVQRGSGEAELVGGRKLKLIRIWNDEIRKYEPLVA